MASYLLKCPIDLVKEALVTIRIFRTTRRCIVCRIVGYVDKEERCVDVLMDGLKNLEYRGYDSAGSSPR
jgi:hypothetical protein